MTADDDARWDQVIRDIADRGQQRFDVQRRQYRFYRMIDRLYVGLALTGSLIDVAYNMCRRRWRTFRR